MSRRRSSGSATSSLLGTLIMIPIQLAWFLIMWIGMKVFFSVATDAINLAAKAGDAVAAKWKRRSLPPS